MNEHWDLEELRVRGSESWCHLLSWIDLQELFESLKMIRLKSEMDESYRPLLGEDISDAILHLDAFQGES